MVISDICFYTFSTVRISRMIQRTGNGKQKGLFCERAGLGGSPEALMKSH